MADDANIDARGRDNDTPLQAASMRGHKEVVKMLVDAGADINAQGGYYGNARRAASGTGYKEVVKILLDAGAHDTIDLSG